MSEEKSTLSDKQRAFCHEYLLDFNGAQAAIRAGYSEKGVTVQATRLLANVSVQKYLAALKAAVRERSDISTERIIEEYANIAFARLPDFVTLNGGKLTVNEFASLTESQKAAIAEISQRKEYLKLKLHGKIRALDSLSRIFGLFDEDLAATEEYIRKAAQRAGLDPDEVLADVFDFEAEYQKRRNKAGRR